MLSNYCQVVVLLFLLYYNLNAVYKCQTSLKCFVDNGCIYLLLINFFYKQVDYLLKCQKKNSLLYYPKDALTKSLFLLLDFLLKSICLYI